MKIELILIGKTQEKFINEGISKYEKRLKHYINFQQIIIPILKQKTLPTNQLKIKEGELILSKINNEDFVVVLDELGKNFTSVGFSEFIQQKMNLGLKKLIFVIGGAFGFSDEVYKRANLQIAFSKMTFTHEMIRLIYVEQIYRAFTILKNEKYHH